MNIPLASDIASRQLTIESVDGLLLAATAIGDGPPLVVCHGSFAVAEDWTEFARALATQRTVLLYDRRGHGATPAGPTGAPVDVELDDLASVVRYAGSQAAVLGHSFGGGCALGWAARDGFANPVLVYEPRHSIDGPVSRGQAAEIRRMLGSEPLDVVLRAVLSRVIGLNDTQIGEMASSPLWDRMTSTVEPFPAEVELLDTFTWSPGDMAGIGGEAWLLIGDDSPVLPADREGALAQVLPGLKRVPLPGLGHFGYLTAPSELAAAVSRCLNG